VRKGGDVAREDDLRTELRGLTTEAADASRRDLDLRTTEELVLAMNDEDARVPAAVRAVAPAIARAVDGIAERMSRGGRLVYLGAGTSGRLGVLDASECPPTFGIDPARVVGVIAGGDRALRLSAESAEDDAGQGAADVAALGLGPDDVLVGIAASGRTPYVVGALEHARAVGALAVAVACNAGSRIGAVADVAIEVVAGPEFIAGSTRLKSGTAQKLVLNTLSTLAMVRLGKTYGNVMIDMRATNAKLLARARRMVVDVTGSDADAAAAALAEAGGSAKAATLMLLAGVSASEAEARLAAAGGRLREALAAG
jgi:N-acetylmuramic acid 6-phosphate etherase